MRRTSDKWELKFCGYLQFRLSKAPLNCIGDNFHTTLFSLSHCSPMVLHVQPHPQPRPLPQELAPEEDSIFGDKNSSKSSKNFKVVVRVRPLIARELAGTVRWFESYMLEFHGVKLSWIVDFAIFTYFNSQGQPCFAIAQEPDLNIHSCVLLQMACNSQKPRVYIEPYINEIACVVYKASLHNIITVHVCAIPISVLFAILNTRSFNTCFCFCFLLLGMCLCNCRTPQTELNLHTYVRMYVCTYVFMYICTYVRMYLCTYVRTYVCTYTYVCVMVRGRKLGGSKSTAGLHSWCSPATLM